MSLACRKAGQGSLEVSASCVESGVDGAERQPELLGNFHASIPFDFEHHEHGSPRHAQLFEYELESRPGVLDHGLVLRAMPWSRVAAEVETDIAFRDLAPPIGPPTIGGGNPETDCEQPGREPRLRVEHGQLPVHHEEHLLRHVGQIGIRYPHSVERGPQKGSVRRRNGSHVRDFILTGGGIDRHL
jgi:hypothetical protein